MITIPLYFKSVAKITAFRKTKNFFQKIIREASEKRGLLNARSQ